jgi:hypothetical protein
MNKLVLRNKTIDRDLFKKNDKKNEKKKKLLLKLCERL